MISSLLGIIGLAGISPTLAEGAHPAMKLLSEPGALINVMNGKVGIQAEISPEHYIRLNFDQAGNLMRFTSLISGIGRENCPRGSTDALLTLRVLEIEIEAVPYRARGNDCFVISAKGNEGLLATIESSDHVAVHLSAGGIPQELRGWYRINK